MSQSHDLGGAAELAGESLDGSSELDGFTIPRASRVFVNRTLRMDQIDWVGFDMDYTLAIYKQDEIDRLSIEATVKKLVARGYPPEIAEARYDTRFAIRGLLIDKRYGHVLKMDRYQYVSKAWHGMRELTREERQQLYHARKIEVAPPRYHWIDTLYALPEAALYAGAVDLLERYDINVDYKQLFDDIRECIDEAHRDGAIVDVIEHDLPRFVEPDPLLASALHRLRSAGKKLFLLTNSRWRYSNAMMVHLLDGQMSEYPSWRNYFDIVSVAASKPVFFEGTRPFFERVIDEGEETSSPAHLLERGRIYEGGNLKDFERLIGAHGDRILYVGDHIYGDILRSKKDSAWRTMMIVQEMASEFTAMERSGAEVRALDALLRRRQTLEDVLRFHSGRLKELTRTQAPEADRMRVRRNVERTKSALRDIDLKLPELERVTDLAFHPYWGSLFKQGTELSSFGDQVEEYACLYTSRVSNLGNYSPQHYFRSPRDLMPHEL